MFDCECIIKKCKAECCGIVPFEKKFADDNKEHLKRKVIKESNIFEDDNLVLLETKDLTCPFLDYDYKCSIYDKRPDVCRKFGDGTHEMMTCRFLHSNGTIKEKLNVYSN